MQREARSFFRVYFLLLTNTLKRRCLAVFLWLPVLGIPVAFLFVTINTSILFLQ